MTTKIAGMRTVDLTKKVGDYDLPDQRPQTCPVCYLVHPRTGECDR
jgi:hypothetical protein